MLDGYVIQVDKIHQLCISISKNREDTSINFLIKDKYIPYFPIKHLFTKNCKLLFYPLFYERLITNKKQKRARQNQKPTYYTGQH